MVSKLGLKRACEERVNWNGTDENLWQRAKAVIATLSESQQDDWNLANWIEREHSDFVTIAKAAPISATDEEIDSVFIRAKALE